MALRNPPKAQPLIQAMGVDPGWALTGYALVEETTGPQYRLLTAGLIEAKGTPKKKLKGMRVSVDNLRRSGEIISSLLAACQQYRPKAIAYEEFQVNPGQVGKLGARRHLSPAAMRTERVVGIVHTLGVVYDAAVFAQIPTDLKRPLTGFANASKAEVQAWCCDNIIGAGAFFDGMRAKKKHEHIADAMGHAVIAIRQIKDLRRLTQL